MAQDGYLFLRNVIPLEPLRTLQAQIGALAREAGWLRADHPIAAAIADPAGFCVDPDPVYLRTLRRQPAGGLPRAEASPPGGSP